MISKRHYKTEIKTKSFTDYVNFNLISSKQVRFLFPIIGFLFFHYTSWSQTITIKNQNTGTVVEHVFIYNSLKTTSTYSDEQGNFNLKEFNEGDSIHFQHPSFYERSFSFSELQKQTIIYLVEHILEIDEFIVSANKWEESYSEIPNTIISINAKQIEFRNPPTSADLLESTGKVFVQKSQLGGGSPMIRGFAANSILIIVDGVRMNNAMFRSGNLQNILNIDPMALESSEVIFGPGSVLYGSDALGGVIDFHTKTSPFTKEKEFNVGARTRYATANSEKTVGINFGYSAKKISFFTHFTYSSFGDLRMGSRFTSKFPDFGKRREYVERINGTDQIVTNANPLIQKQSGYNQYSAVSKLVYQINEKQKLSYGFYLSNTGNIPRYDRLTQYNNGTLRYAEWNYGPQKWMRHSLTLENENKKKAFDESKYIVSYQNFEESRITRSFNNTQRTSRTDILDALNFNFDFNKAFKQSRLFYGAEYIFNSIESSAFTKDIETKQIETTSTRYPDGGSKYHTAAVYLNHKWFINEKNILNLGGRLNYVSLTSRFDDKSFFNFPFNVFEIKNLSPNGNLGWVYLPNSHWKMDILISTGFRAPNVDDAGKLFDSEPYNIIVPNPNLKPENVYNIDYGIQRNFGRKSKLDFTLFYSYLTDIIVRRNYTFNGQDSIIYDGVKSRVQALTNAENGQIYGFSLFLLSELSDHLALSSSLTITKGQDNEGYSIRHAPPLFGQTSLEYKFKKFHTEFYVKYNGAIKFEDLAPSEQNKTDLYTADGSLAWFTINTRFSYYINENFSTNFAVENILDKNYRTYSSGISAPGINGIFSMKVSF